MGTSKAMPNARTIDVMKSRYEPMSGVHGAPSMLIDPKNPKISGNTT